MKENCWEYMECGREPGGKRAEELSVCKVCIDPSFEKINSGNSGGRFCWAIAGTFSKNKTDGFFAVKKESCTDCIFYQKVIAEEGSLNLRTKFLRFIFTGDGSILGIMEKVEIPAGKRLINQGDTDETAYIVERGSLVAFVERNGETHPVNHYNVGDIVGGLGILTGTPRLVSVDAETDCQLFMIKKDAFELISQKDPELRDFLTELAASRFDIKRPVSQRKIGKYLATDIIGRGGYSIVYKGTHESLDVPVVIKMMRHDLALDLDFIENFRAEAHMIAKFNHENIIRVYDIEEIYKTVFIVMEHIEGESLKTILKKEKTLPEIRIIEILTQVLKGLSYAHRNGIVHRDINPDNIMISKEGKIKILDFGLACPLGTEDADLTGTLCYMAKEQIEGDAVDERSDLYSVAVMAYEMITGERPFKEKDFTMLMDPETQCDIPDPKLLNDRITETLRGFIMKAGSSENSKRYKSADEAIEAILHKSGKIIIEYDEDKKDEFQILIDEMKNKASQMGINLKIPEKDLNN